MDEFVIEKYIKISKGISISISISTDITYADLDPHSYNTMQYNAIQYNTIERRYDREHVHVFITKDITKNLNLVCNSSSNLQETSIEIYL